jgi:transglutaminase-like putative cysteine protease
LAVVSPTRPVSREGALFADYRLGPAYYELFEPNGGYLFRDASSVDRSPDGATHAWVEALLPELGWTGFDPTNNLVAGERHVRVAIGRDYADVPPTRGVYKGASAVKSELAVAVRVGSVRSSLSSSDVLPFVPWMSRDAPAPIRASDEGASQQQ